MRLAVFAFLLFFVLPTMAQKSSTSPMSNVSTCHDRCQNAGLNKSKCKWICDGTPAGSDEAGDGDDGIAESCYEKCRNEGTSHMFCSSTCKTKGNPAVKKSCYERCRKDGSSHSHCEFTCR